MILLHLCLFFFFFNDTATTEIYTLSLHDALPISDGADRKTARIRHRAADLKNYLGRTIAYTRRRQQSRAGFSYSTDPPGSGDRKSTRLNSSHLVISYAVFCLKKKTQT